MDERAMERELTKGLLSWYPFSEGASVLYLGDKDEGLAELLRDKGLELHIRGLDISEKESLSSYDYIIIPYELERLKKTEELLSVVRSLLKPHGRLLFGMNNRLGLRNFCGEKDPYTGRNFDGIENYSQISLTDRKEISGREYSRAEIKELLQAAGWQEGEEKFYSVLPRLSDPQLIYAENYLPEEKLAMRLHPHYDHPETVFLNEEGLYDGLIQNGIFHQLANAYLIECSLDGSHSEISHVTLSTERHREDALATVIYENHQVEKLALYPEGEKKFQGMLDNEADLRAHGIAMVPATIRDGIYIMPYVEAELGLNYLQRLLVTDREAFFKEMDRYRELVRQSSERVLGKGDENSDVYILARGYIDLIPLNSFYKNGSFVFYDQELYIENIDADWILYRGIVCLYTQQMIAEGLVSREELFYRYGLEKKLESLARQDWEFLSRLRNRSENRVFLEKHGKNTEMLHSNRQRMNFSEREYQRLFREIFENLEGKELILFGSGAYTKRFLALYGSDYPVKLILDNAESKWGQELNGIPIASPESLGAMEPQSYKLIICIKNYLGVLRQMERLGVRNLGIYDPNMELPRKRRATVHESEIRAIPDKSEPGEDGKYKPNNESISSKSDGKSEKEKKAAGENQEKSETQNVASSRKKYHTGYIAGVFDLFHVGHLNMFKRAKEQCEYLIVGVVTDEGVRKNKKVEPFVPFEERLEMVRSCRYVDEAVKIPFGYGGSRDAYRMYRFDCQFSGSDYVNNPDWLVEKEFLERNGAEMVFFPYTESTSSTKLKAAINERLAGIASVEEGTALKEKQ